MSSQDEGIVTVNSVEGRKALVVYESHSGVLFHITPINLPTLRAIQLRAEALFRYPDKEPFQQPEANAFDPSQLTPAEDHPDYVKACAEIDHQRAQWTDRAIFDFATSCPKYPTRESMVEAFAEDLAKLRKIADLPDDDYEAVLFHLVLTWNQVGIDSSRKFKTASSDYSRIVQLAIQTVALTPSEVAAGVRFFRPALSGNGTRKMAR